MQVWHSKRDGSEVTNYGPSPGIRRNRIAQHLLRHLIGCNQSPSDNQDQHWNKLCVTRVA